MLIRSILSSYSRLLVGVALALVAIALAGCDDKVAEKPAPLRPVLVATARYEAATPERSFVGTVKPRIEADMGFRVAGKVAKRLVEVGARVATGAPQFTDAIATSTAMKARAILAAYWVKVIGVAPLDEFRD